MGVSRFACVLCFLAFASCGEPPSALVDFEGQPFRLWQSSQSHRATVLIFTRSDCPISNRYAPTVRALYDKYRDQRVNFFLVYVDPKESPSTIRRHLEEYDYPLQGVHDPRHELVKATAATVAPEAVVFDAQRKIAYRGRIDDLYVRFGEARPQPTTHDLAQALDAVLAGEPVAVAETKAIGCYIGDLQ